MSIIGESGLLGVSSQAWTLVIIAAGSVLAVWIFIKSKGYRPGLISGPRRLPEDEPIWPMLFIFFGGLSLWAITPFTILKVLHRGETGKIEPSETEKAVLSVVAGAVPMLFVLLGTMTRRERGLEKLGLTRRHFLSSPGPAIAGTLFMVPVVWWTLLLADWVMRRMRWEHPTKHELLEVLDVAPSEWVKVAVVVGAVAVAPLFEELMFRGYLQSLILRLTKRRWVAVLVASALFALVHAPWTWAPIFVLSVCLGYVYERTGNLWVVIWMHAAFNAISTVGSYYGPR